MWATLWHFTTAPRKVQWEVTQPQEGQNRLYLCKIIPRPASLDPGHFTTGDSMPGAFFCCQTVLQDRMFMEGRVDIPSLVPIPFGERCTIYLARETKKAVLRQAFLARPGRVSVTDRDQAENSLAHRIYFSSTLLT